MAKAASNRKLGSDSARVDDYIARSPAFAQPLLKKLRQAFLAAGPQVQETIKWGCPHYEHKGLIGGFAAFKRHVSFGLWRARELPDPAKLFSRSTRASMCQVRIERPSDVPARRLLVQYIRHAMDLNEARVSGAGRATAPRKAAGRRGARKTIRVPAALREALARNARARATFEGFSPSHKREYVEWIAAAKRDDTRARRLEQAVRWMAAGKPRNWKYVKK